jgi:hypothetical protein
MLIPISTFNFKNLLSEILLFILVIPRIILNFQTKSSKYQITFSTLKS